MLEEGTQSHIHMALWYFQATVMSGLESVFFLLWKKKTKSWSKCVAALNTLFQAGFIVFPSHVYMWFVCSVLYLGVGKRTRNAAHDIYIKHITYAYTQATWYFTSHFYVWTVESVFFPVRVGKKIT